jgi:outer membrane protein insertion porin family
MGALVKRVLLVLLVPGALVLLPARSFAQAGDPVARFVGRNITAVHLDVEGRRTDAPELLALLDVRPGQPLDLAALRASLLQLFTAGRFEDISARAVESGAGVELVFDLVPRHVIDRIEFRGHPGLSNAVLDGELRQRFGGLPATNEVDAAARAVERVLAENGYRSAKATAVTEATHLPERATLVITVESGPLAIVRSAKVEGNSLLGAKDVLSRADVKIGEAYRPRQIDTGLDKIIETLRARGYYEASVSHTHDVISEDGRNVDVVLSVESGSLVTLKFAGDPVAGNVNDLVPVRREGSADDDLLEDSVRRIEAALRRDGYWKAKAVYTRADSPAGKLITIDVLRGERYRFDRVEVTGNTEIPTESIDAMIGAQADSVFDETKITRGLAAIRAAYLARGYAAANVTAAASELPPLKPGGEPRVVERITIDEGAPTQVTDVIVTGAKSLTSAEITGVMQLQRGGAYVAGFAPADRDAIRNLYDRRGYSAAVVDVRPQLADDRRFATIHVDVVAEGPRTVVNRIIIVGNKRVSQATILAAVALKPGQTLGSADRAALQQRLAELGLFRRIAITEAPHAGGETGSDLVITVDESPATSVAFGGGVEAGFRARTTAVDASGHILSTVDKLEIAPRASMEIGRSNLWGKNRSVSLFSGISLRPIDDAENPARDGKCCGFSEYRVIGSYREPRVFGTSADGLASISVEQAIRTSFSFTKRAANLQALRRFSRLTTLVGSYSLQRIELKDQHIAAPDQLAVDRLFPQIRLSVFSASLVRDTRTDAISPGGGALLTVDGDLAARAIGSQQGFAKSLFQGFVYRRVPAVPRVVLAGGARLGLLRGFVRTAPILDGAGNEVVIGGVVQTELVEDVNLSQRFFAGGANSARGFGLDRLGAPDVLDEQGLSKGGNGLVLFNGEVRTALTKNVGIVGFVDTGNVFSRVSAISLAELRTSVGTGLRYKSPIGPLRVDFGWKVGALRATDNRRWEFHFSIGEAF